MKKAILLVVGTALLLLGGCGGSSEIQSTACGAGTARVDGQCIAVQDGGRGAVCGAGTALVNGTCVVAPAATITSARMTLLDVRHDLTKPAHLNIPIHVTFGIVARGQVDGGPAPVNKVNVLFSFAAVPGKDGGLPAGADGGAVAASCNAANGIDVNVVGDGAEHTYKAEIVPNDACAALFAPGATQVAVSLAVAFDQAVPIPSVDYPPVTFSEGQKAQPINALCRSKLAAPGPGNPTGCVSNLMLAPVATDGSGTKLVDMNIDAIEPQSVVANVWPTQQDPYTPVGSAETSNSSLVVDLQVALLGRDPTKLKQDYSGVTLQDMSKLPRAVADRIRALPTAEQQAALTQYLNILTDGLTPAQEDALDDLPGPASVQYWMAPATGTDFNNWQQLPIDDPKNPDASGHVMEIPLANINAGEPAVFSHALYFENTPGAAFQLHDALTTGTWKSYSEFKIKGCMILGFPESGDTGDTEPVLDAPAPGERGPTNCKEFRVKVVRVLPASAADNSLSWQDQWDRKIGADVASLRGVINTQNILDLGGARTTNDATVTLAGTIGVDYSVELVRITANAGALTAQASSYYNTGVTAFGVSIASDGNTGSSLTFSDTKTFAKQWSFPTLSWPVGPARIFITGSVGGNLGLTSTITVAASQDASNFPAVPAATSSGQFVATFTPSAELNGSVTGGIAVAIVSVSMTAALQVVRVSAPLVATLQWGVTGGGTGGAPVSQLTVGANAKLDLTNTWLNTEILANGTLGVCFFCVGTTVSIAKFQNPVDTTNIMTRTAPSVVLQ